MDTSSALDGAIEGSPYFSPPKVTSTPMIQDAHPANIMEAVVASDQQLRAVAESVSDARKKAEKPAAAAIETTLSGTGSRRSMSPKKNEANLGGIAALKKVRNFFKAVVQSYLFTLHYLNCLPAPAKEVDER
jgi:hypothetical protein